MCSTITADKKYLLLEFVVMQNHFHLLITPGETLERALQLVKGGFSFRAKRELGFGSEIWQTSYYDRRVRDMGEYEKMRDYIRENPVAGFVAWAEANTVRQSQVGDGRSTSAAKAGWSCSS
jgi:REP-associated tyrosine transposase